MPVDLSKAERDALTAAVTLLLAGENDLTEAGQRAAERALAKLQAPQPTTPKGRPLVSKQPSFIDSIESQREYVKAVELGYGYTRQGNMAHYFFAKDQVEPSVQAELPSAPFYILSFTGCTMASYDPTKHKPALWTPISKPSALDWTLRTPKPKGDA